MCVCVRENSSNQDFGRPDSSWQSEASAVEPLLKPLAESFQNSENVLLFRAGLYSRHLLNETWFCYEA